MSHHIVQKGDTLYSIARQYDTTPQILMNLNEKDVRIGLSIGQKILVSQDESIAPATYKVEPGDSLSAIARMHGLTIAALRQANEMSSESTIYAGQVLRLIPETDNNQYIVKEGESLYSISKKLDVSLFELFELNQLTDDATAYASMVLKVPSEEDAAPSAIVDLETTDSLLESPISKPDVASSLPQPEIGFGDIREHLEDPIWYEVQPGDSLYKIATKFKQSKQNILDFNKLSSDATIFVEQKLIVGYKAAKAITPSQTYIVQKGDWLSKIARKFHTKPKVIKQLNGLKNNNIAIGQILLMPQHNQISRLQATYHAEEKAIQAARKRFYLTDVTQGKN